MGTVLAADEVVDIQNVDGLAAVDSTSASAGGLGFDAEWVNTRGDVGLSDGDFVGVTDFAGTVGSFTDGSQGYELQDADGLYRLTFDEVDLSDAGSTEVSIDYFLQETSWETDDLLRIYVLTDAGAVTMLDSTGLDIDDLGVEGLWTNLSVVLDSAVSSAQLVVELDSNSSSESLYIDNVMVQEVTSADTVSIAAADAETVEGDSGTTAFTFTVTRSSGEGDASVDYTVAAGTADADDFGGSFPGGTVLFADGETEATITIDVTGDTDIEDDETFTVELSNASTGLSIDAGTATGTIIDDDDVTLISDIQGAGDASPCWARPSP